jgi:hypothetical protein
VGGNAPDYPKSVHVIVEFEDFRGPLTSGLTDEVIGIFLENVIITIRVCLSQVTPGHVPSQSKMVTLLPMRFNGDNQVAKTLTVAQLAKHQCKELISACEVLHVAIASILVNNVAKLVII